MGLKWPCGILIFGVQEIYLGGEQSGFITDLGFDTYHKILDDAIKELKETDFKELFSEELEEKAKLIVQDCSD